MNAIRPWNMSLLQKFIGLFILFVMVPVLLMDAFVTRSVSSITEEQVGSAMLRLVQTSHITLDRSLSHIEETTNKILITPEIQNMIDLPGEDPYERLNRFSKLDELLRNYSLSGAVSYSFFKLDRFKLYEFAPSQEIQAKGIYFTSDIEKLPWYRDAKSGKGKGVLAVLSPFGSMTAKTKTLALVKQMNSIINGNKEEAGYLIVSGIENALQKDLDPVPLSDGGKVLLLDRNDFVISKDADYPLGTKFPLSADVSGASSGVFTKTADGHKNMYAIDRSDADGTKLLYVTPLSAIVGDHEAIQRLVIWLMIVYFSLLLLLSGYFVRSIARPLSKLARLTRSYEPGTALKELPRYAAGTKDEIEILYNRFSDMTERLNETIFDKYELEIKQKEAELTILHSQINPHLLYNTLESIYWRMRVEGQVDSAAEMVRDLSLIMRIGLSRGKEIITVGEELEHAEAYVRLQLKRYEYAFKVNWDVEEEAKAYAIPKVVLQPLIENAIVHGIRHMDNDGELWITVRVSGGHIEIAIEDNGYKTKDAEPIRAIAEGKNKDRGYGVRNVNKRIKLHFGEEYGLTYEARPAGGLRALITIPLMPAE